MAIIQGEDHHGLTGGVHKDLLNFGGGWVFALQGDYRLEGPAIRMLLDSPLPNGVVNIYAYQSATVQLHIPVEGARDGYPVRQGLLDGLWAGVKGLGPQEGWFPDVMKAPNVELSIESKGR